MCSCISITFSTSILVFYNFSTLPCGLQIISITLDSPTCFHHLVLCKFYSSPCNHPKFLSIMMSPTSIALWLVPLYFFSIMFFTFFITLYPFTTHLYEIFLCYVVLQFIVCILFLLSGEKMVKWTQQITLQHKWKVSIKQALIH